MGLGPTTVPSAVVVRGKSRGSGTNWKSYWLTAAVYSTLGGFVARGSSTEPARLAIGLVAIALCCWLVVSSAFSTCRSILWEHRARLTPTSTPRYTPMSGLAYIYTEGTVTDVYTEPNFNSKSTGFLREQHLYVGTPVEILEAVWYFERGNRKKDGEREEISCYFYRVRVIGYDLEVWVPQDKLTQELGKAPPCEFCCFQYDCR